MGIMFDRFYHQFFVLPCVGLTYGKPNMNKKYMFCICFDWLCFGLLIGFKKANPWFDDGRL